MVKRGMDVNLYAFKFQMDLSQVKILCYPLDRRLGSLKITSGHSDSEENDGAFVGNTSHSHSLCWPYLGRGNVEVEPHGTLCRFL